MNNVFFCINLFNYFNGAGEFGMILATTSDIANLGKAKNIADK